MNLILFDAPFESIRLEASDPRTQHIRKVLRVEEGGTLYVGFINAGRAQVQVSEIGADGCVSLEVVSVEIPPLSLPIVLLIGLPRPHTAKRILFDAASMGVKEIHFFETEKGEPSYAMSSLWATDEWQKRLRLGAEQGFTPRLPEVSMYADLQTAISALGHEGCRIAVDNYEAEGMVGDVLSASEGKAFVALGAERGFSSAERDVFRKNGWKLAHLGPFVLRTETACIASVSAVASKLNLWTEQTV